MATRLFRGPLPMLVAVVGIAIGAGLTFLSARLGRLASVQYAALPVGRRRRRASWPRRPPAAGASRRSSSTPSAAAGCCSRPIPFDPGWRFLFVVLFAAVVGAGAVARRRARAGRSSPSPSRCRRARRRADPAQGRGARGERRGHRVPRRRRSPSPTAPTSRRGRRRRRLRGAPAAPRRRRCSPAVVVALVALAQTDFLFPAPDKDEVIPPQRPPTAAARRPTASCSRSGPTGKGRGASACSTSTRTTRSCCRRSTRKRVLPVPEGRARRRRRGRETYTADVHHRRRQGPDAPRRAATVAGRAACGRRACSTTRAPSWSSSAKTQRPARLHLHGRGARCRRTPRRARRGARPAPARRQEFAAMPPPPPGVAELLADADRPRRTASTGCSSCARRSTSNVVAAGAGQPVDVLPAKVDAMLDGRRGHARSRSTPPR